MNLLKLFSKFKKEIDNKLKYKIYIIDPLDNVCRLNYSYIMINPNTKFATIQIDIYNVPISSGTIIEIFDISKYCTFDKYISFYQNCYVNGIPITIMCVNNTSTIKLIIGTTDKTEIPNLRCQISAVFQ